MPQIIVGQAAQGVGFAKHGINRRQTKPRDRIDQRDFCMIEDRIGEPDGAAGRLRQDTSIAARFLFSWQIPIPVGSNESTHSKQE
jgi:hypothetical protein